ncbi:MAG: glycerophosphodiester phosphodiesterase, partial [Anaerolineae bacterium]
MLDTLPRPVIFAHRGASAHAPENTLVAFDLALRQGADALELDVKLSADGHVVVIHDATVDRTTDGSGRVNQMNLQTLKALDAGCRFDAAFCGERIPTLDEVLEAFGKRTFINIELTNYSSPWDDLPDKVADLVTAHGVEKRVLFSSFNPLALRRIHRRLPEVPIGLLALPGKAGSWARGPLGRMVPHQAIHPALPDVHPAWVQRQQ